jgi:hypothetical protein
VFPNFRELGGEQFAEEWADTDIGKIIAATSDRGAIAGVVAMFGMIERLLHEPGKRLWTVIVDLAPNDLDQLSVQSENVERATPNVQRSTAVCLIGR